MPLRNKWVGYTQRGYLQIKQSILDRVRSSVPEQTDFSEGNIFVVIISIFAGLVEQIHYYIDQLMRESFITTARRYSSLVRHSRLFDYRIKAANPASVDIIVTLYKDGEPYILPSEESENIPDSTVFTSDNNLQWYPTRTVHFSIGGHSVIVPALQYTPTSNAYTIPNSDPDQIIVVGKDYVHNSMVLVVAGELWQQVSSFGKSLSNSPHYIIDIGLDGDAYIQFGDGVRGLIPSTGSLVNLNYRVTTGTRGNVQPGSFSIPPTLILNSGADEIRVNNPNSASAGTGYEDIESIRKNLPLSLRTLDRAVTKQDYQDIAELHPGVRAAYADYDCGKFVDVYIAPMNFNGGVASTALLESVKEYFSEFKMITTFIKVKPAGISFIKLHLNIVGNPSVTKNSITEQATELLLQQFGYTSSRVNRPIRKSHIYAIIDNSELVKYLNILNLELVPYAFPINHISQLFFDFETLEPLVAKEYRIMASSLNEFSVSKTGQSFGTATAGSWFEVPNEFRIRIKPGVYSTGLAWTIRVLPRNQDLVIIDNSIPVLLNDNISLSITEKLI